MMTMASSQHMQGKENQGFRLLQEENLDDRPCPAVKDFVASVLNKKDLRDQHVASTYRSLVEYRDGRRSPKRNFHTLTEEEDLGLLSPPSSPSSPTGAVGKEPAERLPNKLLDELYEDMGMKSGDQVDLDFVEFLMEQDDGARSLATSEVMGSAGNRHGSNVSAVSSNLSTPSNGSSGGFVGGREWQTAPQTGSGVAASVAEATTALSSTSNSPVRKRMHLSLSEQNSPVQLQQQQEQQQKPQPQQKHPHPQVSGSRRTVQSPCFPGQEFRLPLTPLTPAQGDPVAQESGMAAGASMSFHHAQPRAGCISPRHTSAAAPEQTETASCGSGGSGGGSMPQHPLLYQNGGTRGYSSAACLSHSLPSASHQSVSYTRPGVTDHGQRAVSEPQQHPYHPHCHPHRQQYPETVQPVDMPHHPGVMTSQYYGQQASKGPMYHKPCKQPSPADSADQLPQVRWRFPEVSNPRQTHHLQQGREMGKAACPSLSSQTCPSGGLKYTMVPLSSTLGDNGQTGHASSVSLPSSAAGAVLGTSVSKAQCVQSEVAGQAESLSFKGSSHPGSVHAGTGAPPSANDLQSYARDQLPTDCASAAGSERGSVISRHQASQARGAPCAMSAHSAARDPPISDHTGLNYPAISSAGVHPVSGVRQPDGMTSSNFAPCARSGQAVRDGQRRENVTGKQCNTDFGVLPKVNGSMQSSRQADSYYNQQVQTGLEGRQGAHVPKHNSSHNMNMPINGPSSPFVSNSSYIPHSNPDPPNNLPVNHMRAALQQQGFVSSAGGKVPQHDHRLPQHNGMTGASVTHQGSGDGLNGDSLQPSHMPGVPSHSLPQGTSSVQSDPLESTTQSDLNLYAAMNHQPNPSIQNVMKNNGQDMNSRMNSQDLTMSCKRDMNTDMLKAHPSMAGAGVIERMPPPPSPVGFQPSAISTPVSACRHRARMPHDHRLHNDIPGGYQQPVTNGYLSSSEGVSMSHHYDTVMPPERRSCPPWAEQEASSRQAMGRASHPAQMNPGHSRHPAQHQQLASSQSLPYSQSCSRSTQAQSPSSCFVQSQHTASSYPTQSPQTFSVPGVHAQPPVSFRPVQSQEPSSSHHVQSHLPASSNPIPPQHLSQLAAQNLKFPLPHTSEAMAYPGAKQSLPTTCSDINSTSSSSSAHLGPASRAFSSKQKFIQNLILDEGNSAYRSHPLFPLLRDLVIAGMNFDDPRFHYQPLLCMLPRDFEKLLQNFVQRNPPAGDYQSNFAAESVLMDSLRLAHASLIEKISARQEQDQRKAMMSSSMQAIDNFCDIFDQTQMGPGSGMVNGFPPTSDLHGQHGDIMMAQPPFHIMTPVGGRTKFMVALNEGDIMGPVMLQTLNEAGGIVGREGTTYIGTPKSESKKHPSLPKEAVSRMLEWLKAHKDNPYPNDEEKTSLMKGTGLTINQINYWFTNARRRILPKWSKTGDNSS